MKILIFFLAVLIGYVIWQWQELKKFKVTEYTVASEKIQEPLTLLVAADFHCHTYGRDNRRLVQAVEQIAPDLILVPGDMIVSSEVERYPVALDFFAALVRTAPVYFSNGNHEARIDLPGSAYYQSYQEYKKQVRNLGVHILENEKQELLCRGNMLTLYGLDIPLDCYTKGKVVPLPASYLREKLGAVDRQNFSILLAHNPLFSEDYAAWGANLTVAGHTHGGLIRLPGVGSLISPQFQLFPKYDAGKFTIGKNHVVISKGLGTHTFHIRIFDRAELVVIRLLPKRSAEPESNTNSSITKNNKH